MPTYTMPIHPMQGHLMRLNRLCTTSLMGIAALNLLFSADRASAQSRQVPAPPQSQAIVVHDAAIHPVSGSDIDSGYIVFDHGKITALGSGPAPKTANAKQIDGKGLHVYPGLIAADTQLG